MKYFRFTVEGDPVGKQRPRFTGNGRTYTPQKTKDYEQYVCKCFFEKSGWDFFLDKGEPVYIHIDAYYRIPQNTSKAMREKMLKREIVPAKRVADIDNVLKAIQDGLNGAAYSDDCQIVGASARKFYSDTPMVRVYLSGEPLARFFFEEDNA